MNDAPNAGMVEFWNGDAPGKWVRFQESMDESMAPLGTAVMEALGITTGERVIDVGCGCGGTSLEIAGRVGADGKVLGLDISEPMLALARDRAAAGSHEYMNFSLADAQTHAFDPTAYDVVFSRFGIMFFDQPVAAFENLKAALVSGGRIGFTCWQAGKHNAWIRIPTEIAAAHVPLPQPAPPDTPGEFGFANRDFVHRILDDAGFDDISITDHSVPMVMSGGPTVEDVVTFLTSMGPMARAIAEAGAGEDVCNRIKDDLRSALAAHETDHGIVMECATWIVTARKP